MSSAASADRATRALNRSRQSPPTGSVNRGLWVATALSLAAGAGVLSGTGHGKPAAAVLLILAAIAALCRLSTTWVAAIACITALAFPAAQLPVYTQLAALPIAVVPFAIWLVRTRRRPADTVTRRLAALLGVWFAFSWLLGVVHARSGTVLVLVFLVAVCWAARSSHVVDVEKATIWILRGGTCLGVYAVIEGLVLGKNPLMDPLYARASPPLLQVWDHYRVTTVMGHPLINSIAFAIFGVLALDRVLRTRGTVIWPVLQLALFAVAEALTESRSGLIAAAAGALLVLAVRCWHDGMRPRLALVGALIAVVFAVFAGPVAARFESQEGAGSVAIHLSVLSDSAQAIQGRYVVGVGAGESEASRKPPGGPQPAPLESSYAELFVGAGAVGLLLFVSLTGWSVLRGLKQPENVGWAGALFAFLVGFGGFNAFEAAHQMTVWLGGLVVLATARSAAGSRNRPDGASAAMHSGPPPLRDGSQSFHPIGADTR